MSREECMRKKQIINMLHCNNDDETQELGIKMAMMESDLNFVMQYASDPAYASNCAAIFTSLNYDTCKKYMDDLFSWIEDLNKYCAQDIYEYLKKAPGEIIFESFLIALDAAVKRNNVAMASILLLLVEDNLSLKRMTDVDSRCVEFINKCRKMEKIDCFWPKKA